MNYGMDYQGDSGNAYGGGGGFATGGDAYGAVSSQGGGGASQGSNSNNRRNYDAQCVIPITARMLAAARPDVDDTAVYVLEDDRKLAHVRLVGAVRSFEVNNSHIKYEVEDGTGLFEVKQWQDENDPTAQQEMRQAVQKEALYVKVVGTVKEYDNKRFVQSTSIRPLSTGNELTHHFLEVVYSGEKYKHNDTIVQPASPMMGVTPTTGGIGFGGPSGGSASRTPLMAHGGNNGSGDLVQDDVARYVRENGEMSEAGANVHDCVKFFSSRFSEAQVRTALDNLQAEGLIYSTTNEDNYKSAM